MEVLRFDSRQPNARYAPIVDALRAQLAALPVFCPNEAPAEEKTAGLFSSLMQGFTQTRAAAPAFFEA
jgi:hypothetical protein